MSLDLTNLYVLEQGHLMNLMNPQDPLTSLPLTRKSILKQLANLHNTFKNDQISDSQMQSNVSNANSMIPNANSDFNQSNLNGDLSQDKAILKQGINDTEDIFIWTVVGIVALIILCIAACCSCSRRRNTKEIVYMQGPPAGQAQYQTPLGQNDQV